MQEHLTIPQAVREFVPPQPACASKQNVIPSDIDNLRSAKPFEQEYYPPRAQDRRIYYEFFKRGIDISCSLMLILVSLPAVISIALLIKVSSRGPVIYKHRRLGRYGVEFDCWKFRTMVCDAEKILQQDPHLLKQFDEKFKIDNDPRVTRLGCFLRCTSLDELPQLVQVLQGVMSLIGPRPIVTRELEKYSIYSEKLLSIKPGLSGLWQTSGRSETTYAERVSLDMQYIENRGVLLDLQLLLKTVITVLRKSGAC